MTLVKRWYSKDKPRKKKSRKQGKPIVLPSYGREKLKPDALYGQARVNYIVGIESELYEKHIAETRKALGL